MDIYYPPNYEPQVTYSDTPTGPHGEDSVATVRCPRQNNCCLTDVFITLLYDYAAKETCQTFDLGTHTGVDCESLSATCKNGVWTSNGGAGDAVDAVRCPGEKSCKLRNIVHTYASTLCLHFRVFAASGASAILFTLHT